MDLKTLEKKIVEKKEEGWQIIRIIAWGKTNECKTIRSILEVPTHETSGNFIAKGKKISSYIKNEFIRQGFFDKESNEITIERVYTKEEEIQRENECCGITDEPEPESASGAISLMKELEEEKEKVRRLSEASITLMMCLVEVSKNFSTEDPVVKISIRQMISNVISNVAETLKPFRKE